MKRKIFSLSLTLLLGLFTWNATAATGWYEDYIKISANEGNVWGPSGYYWIDANTYWGTNFVNGFGNVTSLKLDGADIKYWSDSQDRTSGSLFYEVKSADNLTTYTAFTEITTTQTFLGGNNYQGLSSGLNVDLLAGVPAGKACKLTIYGLSKGTGQGDSYLSNFGNNYVATFTKASVAITGATGIADGTSYTTLKGAFDAINANASGVNTDKVSVKVYDNTTETATAVLNPSKGVSAITTSTAGSGFVGPKVTLTGGTKTVVGTTVTTVTNGVITSIVMTGGAWTVAPTSVAIAAGGGGSGATATAALSGSNLTFTVTNGGTGYGPTATVNNGSTGGTGATVDVKLTTGATAPGSAPAAVGVTYTIACAGSGYTSTPTASISAFTGATVGGITVFALNSTQFGRLEIYPTVASKTISGAVGIISLSGCKNVAIDGRVNRTGSPTVGNSANLTISSTHATNAAIALNNNAQNDTVQYCTVKGQANSSALGIINFGTVATLANGNGLNVIDHNLITSYGGVAFTMPTYGIYAQGNSAFPNASNQITNNEFKDLISQYLTSTTVYILGGASAPQNDNYTISGNSFYSANIPNYASSNLTRTIIGIGSSAAAFGGSHTISGNYIGGSAASCSGSLTKTDKEATFYGMLIYPSPSVTSGGVAATSIQNNTIKNISWTNGYFPAGWNAINIGGGTGAVNIGNVTANAIGDNTTNGSLTITNSGASNQSVTAINIATSGTVNCQNNKIGSITASNTAANYVVNINGIIKTATAGTTTISNNIIGSTSAANSISTTSTTPATLLTNQGQGVTGIISSGTGTITISNNIVANLTSNMSGTITTPGGFTVTGSMTGIQCSGTGSKTVSNNIISNFTNNVASTMAANIYSMSMSATTGTINGNLIHSNVITGATTGATLYGILCGGGTNTVTNNILKLGDNNSYEIKALTDNSSAINTSDYHNTVYLSGTPTAGAFGSTCIASSGPLTIRSFKNNILVNNRSNGSGATGVHYAINASPVTNPGTLAVDGNDYVSISSGVGSSGLGLYSTVKTALPIVPSQDAASVSVNPTFANAGGTSATDYMPMFMLGVSGTGVTNDYAGVTTRFAPSIGAYEVLPTVTLSTTSLTSVNGVPSTPSVGWQQSFTVSGSNLAGDVVLTAPTNYQISTVGGGGFTPTSPITLSRTGTSLSSTTIYVRSAGSATPGSYTENISVVVPGSSQNVSCSGVVDITVGAKTPVSDGLRIISANGQVNISGAKAGQLIEVYNASGSRISSAIATEGDNKLTLSAKGFQLIKVGTEVRKLMVK
ncbi:MAG: beta strand repeat-containing protein [Bacteroidales bacterium]